LETEALTRRFGGLTAVDEMTISLAPGEVFGLLGPNGAGKTTAIKMLTTLLPPTSGTAHIAGFEIVRHANSVRRAIGYVPQMISIDPSLTGYENLSIFAKLYEIPRAERELRISGALALVGLTDAAGTVGDSPVDVAPARPAIPGRTDCRFGSDRTPGGLGAYRESAC
jgi:ABC-2 type transport system ATP-binding protein